MKRFIAIMLVTVFVLSACGQERQGNEEVQEIVITGGDNLSDLYDGEEENKETSCGNFGFGINMDLLKEQPGEGELITFDYDQEVKVPYHVENLDESVEAEFGILAFTDGIVQPYRIEDENGNILKSEAYMQKFHLKIDEKQNFYIVFSPVSGKKGEKVGFITASILKPDFMAKGKDTNYGVYYALSATIPQQITISEHIKNSYISEKSSKNVDIPEDVLGEIESSLAGETIEEYLGNSFQCKIESEAQEKFVAVEEGIAKIHFYCLGGPEVLKRLTIFINNQPVKINGADFLEFRTETGKMTEADLEISTDGLELSDYNTMYGVVMTGGEDYTLADIEATAPIVLVN